MSQVSTVADWAPDLGVGLLYRALSFARSAFVLVYHDNPLTWRLSPPKNPQADVEGPFYFLGAPSRQIGEGKGVIASAAHLQQWGPVVFRCRVTDTKGRPVPYAALDWWQADTTGAYYFASWTLRGVVRTDADGYAEVLSVRPGDYAGRVGHIHLVVRDEAGRHEQVTTQGYVLRGNDKAVMARDFVRMINPSSGPVMQCWSVPSADDAEGVRFEDFPELPQDDVAASDSVEWWNARLAEGGVSRKVVAVADVELKLVPLK